MIVPQNTTDLDRIWEQFQVPTFYLIFSAMRSFKCHLSCFTILFAKKTAARCPSVLGGPIFQLGSKMRWPDRLRFLGLLNLMSRRLLEPPLGGLYNTFLGRCGLDLLLRYMGVSKNRGTPKWMVYSGKILLKWMIWGYHYF